ncbi:hypothetical protein [Mesorhizobium sp. M7A.F.Ca.US.008.03.1.1]|uniref:hypothetical protein n=1 Tax=Mesorhizobium sp. M7A.F.Ca.US.008.03.1.1 TaxID=2496742 RepID=UPI000FC9D081|nr:hypothetical protein [Mesorhizobium sp. M7A.F.Ca.US.008.03.1.1]RUW61574.1 hypothetical protein EOA16_11475 [Mesorhizobium sp. M7A.F.Ca.US.008.03.1.1]
MDIAARLTQETRECLERITSLSWDVHAAAIRRRSPRPAGDTYGFSDDGVYFDVGDSAEWLDKPEGDILLKAFVVAFPQPSDDEGIREEQSAILKRPDTRISN